MGWASAVPAHHRGLPGREVVMPFDAGKPNIARAYGYILGGYLKLP